MIDREKLKQNAEKAKEQTRNALQTVFDALNQGQKKKIIRNEAVKKIFNLYGVEY